MNIAGGGVLPSLRLDTPARRRCGVLGGGALWIWHLAEVVSPHRVEIRFLSAHQRTASKRTAVADLARYLTTTRARMRYETFRAAGHAIGSGGAVESAVSDVVQQRMKRIGMRWRAVGADAMLALRSIHRATGAWDRFWSHWRIA